MTIGWFLSHSPNFSPGTYAKLIQSMSYAEGSGLRSHTKGSLTPITYAMRSKRAGPRYSPISSNAAIEEPGLLVEVRTKLQVKIRYNVTEILEHVPSRNDLNDVYGPYGPY